LLFVRRTVRVGSSWLWVQVSEEARRVASEADARDGRAKVDLVVMESDRILDALPLLFDGM
jgi:hypothetical protein